MVTRVAVCILAVVVSVPAGAPVRADAAVSLLRVPDGGFQPRAVADPTGVTHVVYFRGEAAHGDLFYVRVRRDGAFGRSIRINSGPGSAMATGTMRGGQIAVGLNGRVFVAWHGSDLATPRPDDGGTPVLFTRLNDAGTAFEPERNVVQRGEGLDAGTVAADGSGNVFVAWHALIPGGKSEADRRVWVARSTDDGRTFSPAVAVSDAATGSCGCCGLGAFADRRGLIHLLYRGAVDVVHRDTYLLTSIDHGASFTNRKLHEWNVGACPMSTFTLSDTATRTLAAWETDGRVYWTALDPKTGAPGLIVGLPGSTKNQRHPVIAANAAGGTLLGWTEGTGWNKGGGLAWQRFDREGKATLERGQSPGMPTWGLAAVVVSPDGRFTIVY